MATAGRKPQTAAQKEAAEKKRKDESKVDRFNRLAPGRVDNALRALHRLETFGSTDYELTPAQAKQIADVLSAALGSAVSALQARSEGKGSSAKAGAFAFTE